MWLGGSQGQFGYLQKIALPLVFDPWTMQPTGICYTDSAIVDHKLIHNLLELKV